MAHSKVSPVWQYFTISTIDDSRVNCKLCNSTYARGTAGKRASYNTSNMRKHLEVSHSDAWEVVKREDAGRKAPKSVPSKSTTPSILQAFDNKRPWDFDDERSRRIHRLIGEMIARDDQPFNIVNNEGLLIQFIDFIHVFPRRLKLCPLSQTVSQLVVAPVLLL